MKLAVLRFLIGIWCLHKLAEIEDDIIKKSQYYLICPNLNIAGHGVLSPGNPQKGGHQEAEKS